MSVGERLRMIRKKEKLLLKEMGAMCDITAQSLSRYENNDRKPDFDFLENFVRHFKVSLDWLLFGEPPIYRASDLDRNVRESFIELSHLLSSKEISDIDIQENRDYTQLTDDSPENYLLLLKYMMKSPIIRKGIFQVFYLILKPLIDKYPAILEQGE